MSPATVQQASAIRFDLPVRMLLDQKGHAVWSISPDATVLEAITMMSDKHVGALLVMRGGFLAGIVSERDYARKVILRGKNSQDTRVKEIMSSPVMYVTPSQTLEDCMTLMTTRRIRHLPVVEGDEVRGVISIGDLVNWIMASQQQEIDHLRSYISGSYPG